MRRVQVVIAGVVVGMLTVPPGAVVQIVDDDSACTALNGVYADTTMKQTAVSSPAGGTFRAVASTPTPIENDIEGWILDKRRRRRADWKRDEAAMRRWVAAAGWKTAKDMTPDSFSRVLASEGNAGRTQNRQLSIMSGFLKYLQSVRPHDAPVNWALGMPKASTDDATEGSRFLAMEEFSLLLTTCAEQYRRDFYMLIGYTGQRYSAAKAIMVRNVMWGEAPRLELRKQKNGKQLIIPIHPDLRATLERLTMGRDPDKSLLDEYPTNKTLKSDCLRAGIDPTDVGFHSFRKLCASRMALSGVPLAIAQKILGHSTPALTANLYTRFADRELSDAYGRAIFSSNSVDAGQNGRYVGASHTAMKTPTVHSDHQAPGRQARCENLVSPDGSGLSGRMDPTPHRGTRDFPSQASKPPVGFEPTTCALQMHKPSASKPQAVARLLREIAGFLDSEEPAHAAYKQDN